MELGRVNMLVEILAKSKVGNGWRKEIHLLIEIFTQFEVGDRFGKIVNWLVEPLTKYHTQTWGEWWIWEVSQQFGWNYSQNKYKQQSVDES